jgi:hypothetical protein
MVEGKWGKSGGVFIDFMGFLKNISLTAQKITLNS